MTDRITFDTGPLTRERIAQFSRAMRDPNPVHLDAAFCSSIGLPGIIAPGGIAVVALAHAVGLRHGCTAIRELDISFRHPVYEGESLQCGFEVLDSSASLTRLRVYASAPDGRICADGLVTVERRIGGDA